MNSQVSRRFLLGLSILMLTAIATNTKAQAQKRPIPHTGNLSVVKVDIAKDSIEVEEKENVIHNKVMLINNSSKYKRITVFITIPTGWSNLSKRRYTDGEPLFYDLAPGQELPIRLNLLKLPNASASWQQVKLNIAYREFNADTQRVSYNIRTAVHKTYAAKQKIDRIEIREDNKVISPSVYLKNTGNVVDTYRLVYKNFQLSLHDSVKIVLKPGADTLYEHKIPLTNYRINNYKSDRVSLNINNTEKSYRSLSYYTYKYSETNKLHKSHYDVFPIQIEGGILGFGNQFSYFGAGSGSIRFDESKTLDFRYRSKQFGALQTGIRRNVFRINYMSDKWEITAGQVTVPYMYFLTNIVRGLDVTYHTNKNLSFNIQGTLHDTFTIIKNDNIQGGVRYGVGKVGLGHTVVYNMDRTNQINSVLLLNDVNLIAKKDLKLNLEVGTGVDEDVSKGPQNTGTATPGLKGKYEFLYTKNNFLLSSTVNYHNRNFPGLRRGAITQNHELNWTHNSITAGVFYSYNYILMNYFRDSLFNSDLLSYNTARQGMRFSKSYGGQNMTSISSGIITQKGSISLFGGMKNAYFVDVIGKKRFWNNWEARLIARSAFGKNKYQDKNILVMTSTATLISRYLGLNMVYSRTPLTNTENGNRITTGYQETINGGPSVNFYLFKNSLSGTVRYNVSRSLQDTFFIHGVGGSLTYNNYKSGMGLNFSCFYPFAQQTNDPGLPIANRQTVQLSAFKNFNVPIVVKKRKYYDLSVTAYEDKNNNHEFDEGEPTISDVQFLLDKEPFVTNKNGIFSYHNISNGTYDLQIQNNGKNIIPIDGVSQTLTVFKNTDVAIPFKKGRVITGRINITYDSLQESDKLPLNYIRIYAVDTAGEKYSTLANVDGEFKFSVPDGTYKVSLSPSVLQGTSLKAVRMNYDVDLTEKEKAEVTFTIQEKKRQIRFLKQ